MSAITVRCPKCGGKGRAPDLEAAGRATCRRCGVPLVIGDPERGAPVELDRIGVDLAEAPGPRVMPAPVSPRPGPVAFDLSATGVRAGLVLLLILGVVGSIFGPARPANGQDLALVVAAVSLAGLAASLR